MALFSQAPQSLCILRLSAIGDVCHALAAVQHIQRYWPNTQITWIIGKTEAQLFRHVSGIEFIVYDKKSGWRGVWDLWRQLKHHRFDALLNMQTAFRASILSPAKPHVLDGFMAFSDYLGVLSSQPQWDLPVTEADLTAVREYLDPHRKNLLISPCSSKKEKDWLVERYAAVANWAHRHDINVILCSSPAPRELAMIKEIKILCNFAPVEVAGKLTLTQLTALIREVDLVISPDSGPAHIATTQGTPVIGLYAYHNPLRTGPYRNLDNVVSVYEQNVQREYGKPSAQLPWATKLKGQNLMAQIEVKEVVKQMEVLLLP